MSGIYSEHKHLTFVEFCRKFNEGGEFRKQYLEHPVKMVDEVLGIRLSDTQQHELIETVQKLKDHNPNFKLYVAGQDMKGDPQSGGAQPHAH